MKIIITVFMCFLIAGCDKLGGAFSADKNNPSMVEAQLKEAKTELDNNNYGKTVEISIKISEEEPKNFKANYLHSQASVMAGNVTEALDQLEQAFKSGFKDFDDLENNKNLNAIKENPKYKLILQKYDPNFSSISITETEVNADGASIKNLDGKQVVKAGDVSVSLPND